MIGSDSVSLWVQSSLLLSLRISPVFAMAPPFTLIRVPTIFRALMGVALAAGIIGGSPIFSISAEFSPSALIVAAAHELLVGGIFVLAFQLAFAGLYLAGRSIDIQAGFGLAGLIDPGTRVQTPLVGTLFAMVAGAMFFAMDGHLELLRLLSASLRALPLSSEASIRSLGPLTAFTATTFASALGVGAAVMIGLFLADMAIALLSRTVPQMNVLVLGFQVKTILLLVLLPTSFGLTGALLARTTTQTLQAIPGLL